MKAKIKLFWTHKRRREALEKLILEGKVEAKHKKGRPKRPLETEYRLNGAGLWTFSQVVIPDAPGISKKDENGEIYKGEQLGGGGGV